MISLTKDAFLLLRHIVEHGPQRTGSEAFPDAWLWIELEVNSLTQAADDQVWPTPLGYQVAAAVDSTLPGLVIEIP